MEPQATLVLNIAEAQYNKLLVIARALSTNPDRIAEIILTAALNDSSWSIEEVEKSVSESQKKETKD